MRNKELFSTTFIDKIQQTYASSKLINIDKQEVIDINLVSVVLF